MVRPMHRFATPMVVVLALVLAGCAGSGATPTETPSPDREMPQPAPPGDPEALVQELRQYAAQHPDEFGGLYMHPPGSGSFVLLFTDRLEEHAAALAAISARVSVAPARYTEAELLEVMDQINLGALQAEGVEPISASLDTIGNRVVVELKSNDPTIGPRLELAHGGRLQVIVHPLPGPWRNVESGNGWRLLDVLAGPGDEAFTVRAATDRAALAELWGAVGGTGNPPDVDLEREVVVSFAHGIGSSCPELRLDGVDLGGGLVTSEVSDPLAPRACTADLVGAVVFVVAIERSALPADGFRLALTESFGETIEVPLP
jgi:hypothetical protein